MQENRNNTELSAFVFNYCIDYQNHKLLERLLSQQLIDVNSILDDYIWRPIHRAVHLKDVQLIQLLLEKGNHQDNFLYPVKIDIYVQLKIQQGQT